MPPAVVSARPGTPPSSTPSDTRPRDCTSEVHVVGPQPSTTDRRTSSGRAASANQGFGLHLTRPNTEPVCMLPASVTNGVPTARSSDAEDESHRRERTAGASPRPNRARPAHTDPPNASAGPTLGHRPPYATSPGGVGSESS